MEQNAMRRVTTGLILAWIAAISMPVATGAQAAKGGNPAAAALKNPVKATPDSIAKGRQVFNKACRQCHGAGAQGDGPLAPKNPSPANLTDATWDHGDSDGEIYTIISNGVGAKSEMKGLRSELTPTEMWSIVNYIRSLGPKP
jgi:mono/diheme cytochrome c family protein